MAAATFYLPFRPALDANGIIVEGAKLYFYATGTTTPQSIYSNISLTTPLTNPVQANAAGVWPTIYLDNSKTYRVLMTTSGGITLDDQDPYIPGFAEPLDALELGYLTVEAYGATGTPGTNDQPAIQAAIDAAVASGIREVRFLKATYESWHPPFPGGSPDPWLGMHLVITGDVALIGAPGGTVINLKGHGGVARTKTDGQSNWYSGAVLPVGNGVTRSVLHRLKFNGGITFANNRSNAESNVFDKGILINEGLVPNLVYIENIDCDFNSFAGEIFYMGGSFANTTAYIDRLRVHNSPQCCFNPSGTGGMLIVSIDAYDGYQPMELAGANITFLGGEFREGYGTSVLGTNGFQPGFNYAYPYRDPAQPLKWITFLGTKFTDISDLGMSAFIRGNIVTVDVGLGSLGYAQDIHLDVVAWCDKSNNAPAFTFGGQANLTTAWNSPPSVYQLPAHDLRINVQCLRTANAKANGWKHASGVRMNGGLWDKDSCQFVVSGEAGAAFEQLGTPVANFALPRIDTANFRSLGQPGGGTYITPTGTDTIQVKDPAYALAPNGAGTFNIDLGTTYGYPDGQEVALIHNASGTDRVCVFPASSSALALPAERRLYRQGDRLVLRYDAGRSRWLEKLWEPASQRTFTGSKTYDAPSVAAAGTMTTTVTVTGAALGDKVSAISLGVDAVGLVVTGYVSAADTVTVVLFNPTAGAIDLASTTLSVEVKRP